MKRLFQSSLIVLMQLVIAIPVLGGKYYVSPDGNDENSGTSPLEPWCTIEKVNAKGKKGGDTIFFAGGYTFMGPLLIKAEDSGTKTDPTVITSYGVGRAKIHGANLHAIVCEDVSYLNIQNINVEGFGISTGQLRRGSGINITGGSFITIDQVEASGFRYAGVRVEKCPDLRITNVYAHSNGYAGIKANDVPRLYIGYCRTNNNPGDFKSRGISGSGIEVWRMYDGVIEFCEAAYNGGKQEPNRGNGPVGIWIAYTYNSIIQYNIAHHNTNLTGDGGGLDIDSESYNNIFQYNYCYDNKNYGIQLWQWRGEQAIEGNIIRYNIFQNTKDNTAHTIWVGHNEGTPEAIGTNYFYNNLVINEGPAIGLMGYKIKNLQFYNNIFITDKGTNFLVGAKEDMGFVFKGNVYWSMDNTFNMYNKYKSIQDWAKLTGQEKVNDKVVGVFAEPKVSYNDINNSNLTDPNKLPEVFSSLMDISSPCVNNGLNLKTLLNFDVGGNDLVGNPIPQGEGFDIGPVEYK